MFCRLQRNTTFPYSETNEQRVPGPTALLSQEDELELSQGIAEFRGR